MTTTPLPKRFQTQVEISRTHIVTLRGVIILLALMCLGLWYGWTTAPKDIIVHIPPDLRAGASASVNAVPAENVYVFASYIWQQLHRWSTNGDDDYAANIYRLQNFITPRFYAWLEKDYQNKYAKGELRNKIRAAAEIPGHNYEPDRVVILGDGAWLVWLDFKIDEWVGELNTKSVGIRYPMRVVRFAVDREQNPWGLALDGYPAEHKPTKLDPTEDSAAGPR